MYVLETPLCDMYLSYTHISDFHVTSTKFMLLCHIVPIYVYNTRFCRGVETHIHIHARKYIAENLV